MLTEEEVSAIEDCINTRSDEGFDTTLAESALEKIKMTERNNDYCCTGWTPEPVAHIPHKRDLLALRDMLLRTKTESSQSAALAVDNAIELISRAEWEQEVQEQMDDDKDLRQTQDNACRTI